MQLATARTGRVFDLFRPAADAWRVRSLWDGKLIRSKGADVAATSTGEVHRNG